MILDLNKYSVGSAVIITVILVTVALQVWLKHRLGKETIKSFHEVGGYYMSVAGTLYAVILGMVVVDSLSHFNEAKQHLETEAHSLEEVYLIAEKMPEPYRSSIRGSIRNYTEETLKQGWQHMQIGERDTEGLALFDQIILEVREVEPVTENQKTLYATMVNSVINAGESRRDRLIYSHNQIPDIEWFSLIIGGIMTILFTMFFTSEYTLGQAIMTAMVTLLVSLNLYLAFLFSNPYNGDLQVPKDGFITLKHFIETNRLSINEKRAIRGSSDQPKINPL